MLQLWYSMDVVKQQSHYEIDDIKAGFNAYLIARASSERTIETYQRIVDRFLSQTSNRQITKGEVARFLGFIEQNRSTGSLYMYSAILRVFLRYLKERGVIEQDLADGIKMPVVTKRWKEYLSQEDLENLRRKCWENNTPIGLRAAALVEALYMGLKVSECVAMEMSDLDLQARTATVGVKKQKRRTLTMSRYTRSVLKRYLDARSRIVTRSSCSNASGPLFINRYGNRLSTRSIQRNLKSIGNSAGMKLSPEILRNTRAIELCRKGTDVSSIADVVGYDHEFTAWQYKWLLREESYGEISKDRKWIPKIHR